VALGQPYARCGRQVNSTEPGSTYPQRWESANIDVPNNAIVGGTADCNPGETAIAGGAIWETTPVRNQMPTLEG
jgi:hypothetical protein